MTRRNNNQHRSSGFTIVELLVVIVVIGVLAAITVVSYAGITQKATIASLNSDLDNASKQLKLFQISNNNYPATIDCMQADSATNKCIKSSNNATYQYAVNNATPQVFCITAAKDNIIYNIATDNPELSGPCPVSNLDAGNKTSFSGIGTIWTDLSGNGNNGTLYNGVNYSSANSGSLLFDGVDDYATSNYVPGIASNQLTISSWLKLANVSGVHEISNQYQWDGGPWNGWRLQQVDNTIRFKLGDGTSTIYECSGGSLIAGNWQYVVAVWDGTYIRIYVNGAEATNCPKNLVYAGNSGAYFIGKYPGLAYFFGGSIGNISVYNTALSANTIQQNFNSLRSRYGI